MEKNEYIKKLEEENKKLVEKLDAANERISRMGIINEDLYSHYMHLSRRIACYEAAEPKYRRI